MRRNTRIQGAENFMAFVFWGVDEDGHAEFISRDRKVSAIVYCDVQRRLRESVRTKRSGRLWRAVICLQENAF